ncbi:hypothetical protein D3C72_1325290 [compost metagenome]
MEYSGFRPFESVAFVMPSCRAMLPISKANWSLMAAVSVSSIKPASLVCTDGVSANSRSLKYGFCPLTMMFSWCRSAAPASIIAATPRPSRP